MRRAKGSFCSDSGVLKTIECIFVIRLCKADVIEYRIDDEN